MLLPTIHVLSHDGYLDSKGWRRTHRSCMTDRNQGLQTTRHFRSKHKPYQSSGYEIAPWVKIYWWHLNLENSFALLINRLTKAWYVIRSVKVHVSTYTSYYTLCPFSFRYDIWHHILWESIHSSKVFNIQKTAIRIIMGRWSGESCRNLFERIKNFATQIAVYTFFTFIATNIKSYFKKNSENYSIHTRHSNALHLPQTNLAIYQKGVYHSGVKIFHNFLSDIKNTIGNLKRFKRTIWHTLIAHSFYTLEEYYSRWYMWYMLQFQFLFPFLFNS